MLDVDIREKRFVSGQGDPLVAIRDLAFSVADGEFVCLMGPSGCGKTTTLRILLGLDIDYSGTVSIGDRRRRLGVMFQEPLLLPWLTVDANVRLALPKPERERDLCALYQQLGLTGMERFYPAELSVGLARRAAMARAFAISPSLLILDEPFVSLDEETAAGLRRLLVTVWEKNPVTVLMVTHNLREAVELADRIVLLTPRPAHVRGIVTNDVDRSKRNADRVLRLVNRIAKDYPGLV